MLCCHCLCQWSRNWLKLLDYNRILDYLFQHRFQKTSELAGIDSDENFIFPITSPESESKLEPSEVGVEAFPSRSRPKSTKYEVKQCRRAHHYTKDITYIAQNWRKTYRLTLEINWNMCHTTSSKFWSRFSSCIELIMCAFLRCSNAVHLYSMPPVPVALCYPFEQTFFFEMFALHTSSYTHINPCKWTNTAWCDKTKTPFAERARKMEQTHRPRSVFNRGSGCERKVR